MKLPERGAALRVGYLCACGKFVAASRVARNAGLGSQAHWLFLLWCSREGGV